MRITGIRYNNKNGNGKPTDRILIELCDAILTKTDKAGFITQASPLTGSAIKVGLHMSSFRINTEKLGHNGRVERFVKSPKGYKRTDVPTWDQRVEFNDIINAVLDRFSLIANIKSGPFTVRDKARGAYSEQDWQYQGEKNYDIQPEADTRESCDSDRLEAEHKLATAEARRETAKAYRERMRLFNASKYVIIGGASYPVSALGQLKNGSRITHNRFAKLIAKLSGYSKRTIKRGSIEATISQVSHD